MTRSIATVAVLLASLGALSAQGCDGTQGGNEPGTGTPPTGTPPATTPSTTPATTTTSAGTTQPSPTSSPGPAPAGPAPAGLPASQLSSIAAFDANAISGGLLLKAVQTGQFEAPTWVEIEWDGLVIKVGAEVLRAKIGDRLMRLPASWKDTLAICKKLDWCPPTSALSDAVWQASTLRVPPVPIGDFSTPEKAKQSSQKMVRMGNCKQHNDNIDAKIPAARASELIATEGKDWIFSKRNLTVPNAATTYGWHYLTGKPIQGLGPDYKPPAHDDGHFDQTQLLRPIQRKARRKSDGAIVDLVDELQQRGMPAGVVQPLRQ